MEYNFWDDRTYCTDEYNPCEGCEDFVDGGCISNGACCKSDKQEQLCKDCWFNVNDKCERNGACIFDE